jgi:hypothetical protein
LIIASMATTFPVWPRVSTNPNATFAMDDLLLFDPASRDGFGSPPISASKKSFL